MIEPTENTETVSQKTEVNTNAPASAAEENTSENPRVTIQTKVLSSKSDADDKKWFVVRAISGKEKKIK
ncbi:MAG: hypothetical protein AABZ32_11005, partial [Bacteroidota bacterium]